MTNTKTYPEEYIKARQQLIDLKAEMKQAIADGVSEDDREGIWDEIEQCWYHILDLQSEHGFELDVSINNIIE
jgi:phosphoribosyl-ATP pyrophosphohydrolase